MLFVRMSSNPLIASVLHDASLVFGPDLSVLATCDSNARLKNLIETVRSSVQPRTCSHEACDCCWPLLESVMLWCPIG